MPAPASVLPPSLVVLVAEDDADTASLWRAIIAREAPTCRIATAVDGAEAVQMARELEPDVVLMDLVMPGVDGLTATKTLKSDPSTARIPVIAVTGQVYSSQRVLEAGCDGYLLKPVSERALIDGIRRALRVA